MNFDETKATIIAALKYNGDQPICEWEKASNNEELITAFEDACWDGESVAIFLKRVIKDKDVLCDLLYNVCMSDDWST